MTRKARTHRKARPVRAVPILSEDTSESVPNAADPLAQEEELQEAEREIGINEWIDVETGEPAEGQSPPHLEEE